MRLEAGGKGLIALKGAVAGREAFPPAILTPWSHVRATTRYL
jgi:hypothetical protein